MIWTEKRGHSSQVIHTQVNWGKYQGRCVRDNDYAYVARTGEHEQEQLFDLKNDSGEHVDVLSHGDH